MRTKVFFLIKFVAIFLVFGFFKTASADTLSLTAGSNATTTPNVATAITGFQIVGPTSQTTPVKIRATSGTLNLSTISGVTMTGNGTGTVNLSGTVEKLNQALSTLTYTRGSTGTDTLEVSLVESGEVFFEDNGHLYKFITSTLTWNAAKTAAESQTAYGVSGYLATVSTTTENTFISARLVADGWFGASDSGSEGAWKWVTGPENGTTFWNGASGGSVVSGQYANWNSGEPNDSGGNEDCAQYYSASGKWNDLPCTGLTLSGYVVEFGAPGNLPTVVAQNISIVTADVPTITSFYPANASTTVATTSNLVIGFSKSVTNQTGNILIKKVSDDSVAETIDASGVLISGSGTNSITINPSSNLEEGTQYYVIVPGTAFKDSSNNFFAGFSASSTWAFTTGDTTSPVITNIATSSVATTSAAISWNTNEAASTKVVYSTGSSFASTTSETDTSPRLTSHTKTISNLTACTTYNFKVVSRDGFANAATSSSYLFTTLGCPSYSIPTSATTSSVTVSGSATSTLTENGRGMQVETPANFTATSSTVVIQIRSMEADPVLESLSVPSGLSKASQIVFDVKALINGSVELDSFDHPVTMTYTYTDEDVTGLDESTLWMYHYHDSVWEPLDDCTVDAGANTITCDTPNFSIFGIFGSPVSAASTNSTGGASIKSRVAHFAGMGDTASAEQLKKDWHWLFGVSDTSLTVSASTSYNFTRDLYISLNGEDVRELQNLLISKGFAIPAGATGYFGAQTKSALSLYQSQNGILPSLGYFGPKTRAFIRK